MTREMKQIFTRRITQANRTQLVVILYDMVLEYLKEAIAAQEIDCIQEYKKAMQCARNCISELRNSLDFNYEISKNLFAIYAFADRELASEMHSIKKRCAFPDRGHVPEAARRILYHQQGGPLTAVNAECTECLCRLHLWQNGRQ